MSLTGNDALMTGDLDAYAHQVCIQSRRALGTDLTNKDIGCVRFSGRGCYR